MTPIVILILLFFIAPCKGIRNPESSVFCLWNPESEALESGIRLLESGIHGDGIRNPGLLWNPGFTEKYFKNMKNSLKILEIYALLSFWIIYLSHFITLNRFSHTNKDFIARHRKLPAPMAPSRSTTHFIKCNAMSLDCQHFSSTSCRKSLVPFKFLVKNLRN